MEKYLKELHGHSGSSVYLMENNGRRYILKKNNVERNHERLNALQGIVNVPMIWGYDKESLCMEYIHGLDMKNYLRFNNSTSLLDFIIDSIEKFRLNEVDKDYTEVYDRCLDWLKDDIALPFTKEQLIDKLPKILPQSLYHGDMTLENIIQRTDGKFFFIDAVTVAYDSWVFDIAKLQQDLECGWFLRRDNIMLDAKLKGMQQKLLTKYPVADNKYLIILMLLRVYLHCEKDSLEYKFILREVHRLWK